MNKASKSTEIESQILSLSKKLDKMNTNGSSRTTKTKKKRNRTRGSAKATTFQPTQQLIMSKAADTGLRRLRRANRQGMSDAGIAFLKCAFAPPDFQANSVSGIPDDFRGATLTKKHRSVGTFQFSTGNDYYFALIPSPGICYYLAVVAAGTPILANTVFNAVYYSDYQTLFGSTTNQTANQVNRYRFVSNHFELIPTINQMTWSGSIQAWKAPIQMVERPAGATTSDLFTVTGLNGANTTIANQYSGPFIMGLYTGCYNNGATYSFCDVYEALFSIPNVVSAADFGQLVPSVSIPGIDNNFESMFIKVSGITASETAILKTWACVEYQVISTSSLYEYQSLSPHDPLALELYREIISNLPVGVPFEENEGFWQRVLRIVNQLSRGASLLPGAPGLFASGLSLMTDAGLHWTG